MKHRPPKAVEVLSLNQEFMQFDPAQLHAEELERRLELALATVPIVVESCVAYCEARGTSCDTLDTTCGMYCQTYCAALAA
jgi:hypothetical protein